MRNVLGEDFFIGDTLQITQRLLGKYLVRRDNGEETALMITEVEAYDGPDDKACHACKGKTPRTEVMFARGGRFYVYFIYGVHWMLNIVVGHADYPAAALIRGAGEINGPARLTKALRIDKAFNKKPASEETGLWVEDRGVIITEDEIIKTPRIGVSYAGEVWSQKPYRFLMKG